MAYTEDSTATVTTVMREWPPSPEVVRPARYELRSNLEGWGVERDPVDCAELIFAELLTNAIQHARGLGDPVETRWSELIDGRLRLEALDGDGERWPRLRPAGPLSRRGHRAGL